MNCKVLDEDSVARWKRDTKEACTRLVSLWLKAEDNGLTDEERAEMARLKAYADGRFREFLAENPR